MGQQQNSFYQQHQQHQDSEKPETQFDAEALDEPAVLTTTTERRLMAKIDWHLIPILSLLYLLAFLDRVNISNATIFNLKQDLNIEYGLKYNTALAIFFVPYAIFEVPSNILLKRLKPHVWLSLCMFLFGIMMMCQGFTKSWGGLMATRFLLGMFETGMFPGCFYLMGMWYRRNEAQKRFTFFFSSTTLAGAFGGLLASAIGKMDGMRGYHGWRWIFIIEGLATIVIGIASFFIVPDFPEDVKWLNEEEREFIRVKLAKDVGKSAHSIEPGWRDVLNVFKDYKIFVASLMYFGLIVPAYGYAYFAPTIIQTFGYGQIKTQLYSIPPWAAAWGFAMAIATCSDRLRHRFVFTLIPIAIAIAGFGILLNVHGKAHRNVEYGALFLVTIGCYSSMPIMICWFTMNLGGHVRRSVGTAWQIGFGNLGGIVSTYAFLQKDAPNYRPGHIISISFICLAATASIAYFVTIWFENRNRDRQASVSAANEGISEEDEEILGDMAPNYRYQY